MNKQNIISDVTPQEAYQSYEQWAEGKTGDFEELIIRYTAELLTKLKIVRKKLDELVEQSK